jgi:superoxide dismutase, Cu-Zn family
MPMRTLLFCAGLLGALSLQGCAQAGGPGNEARRATATLAPIGASGVTGTVRFTPVPAGVRVTADVAGLRPNAEHGFHVHEIGDCGSPDGMSAGDHFDPTGQPHGHPATQARHAGDMPNLQADGSGRARARFEVSVLTVGDGATDVIGRSVLVHRDPDDYVSQPAGNAGPRLACGVIRGG